MKRYAWIKGNRIFVGKRGTKFGLAQDLILMDDIKINYKDQELLLNLSAATVLEKKGWKWKPIKINQ